MTITCPGHRAAASRELDAAPPAFVDDFSPVFENATGHLSAIGCVIAAHNDEPSIAAVLQSLLAQTRVPDVIHVVVNNTTDATVKVASAFAGPHEVTTDLGEQFTEVFVHDIGENLDKKVGALNYGYALVEGYDYLLGVDGDTTADPRAVEYLEAEAVSDSRIGGISAIYSIDDRAAKGLVARFLIAGQRTQLAASNLQNLRRGRNTAVLGGQFSIFSTTALRQVMTAHHQSGPWVKDSEIEDSLLSLQIKSAGFLTKISPFARADVRGMTTLRDYDAQQVTWTHGSIELMWPGQRGDIMGQPLHPNLRLRWRENIGMLASLFVRVAFVMLLAGSLSIGAFVFSPLWLIPPVLVAVLLNLRTAYAMKNRNGRDIAFAGLVFPAEIFTWVRISHFLRSWARFLSRKQVDSWVMHARAERRGGAAHWMPLALLIAVIVAMTVIWTMLSHSARSAILWGGWPILGVVAALQTLAMVLKLRRRHQGYQV